MDYSGQSRSGRVGMGKHGSGGTARLSMPVGPTYTKRSKVPEAGSFGDGKPRWYEKVQRDSKALFIVHGECGWSGCTPS